VEKLHLHEELQVGKLKPDRPSADGRSSHVRARSAAREPNARSKTHDPKHKIKESLKDGCSEAKIAMPALRSSARRATEEMLWPSLRKMQ
jgi:hypothetical protein